MTEQKSLAESNHEYVLRLYKRIDDLQSQLQAAEKLCDEMAWALVEFGSYNNWRGDCWIGVEPARELAKKTLAKYRQMGGE